MKLHDHSSRSAVVDRRHDRRGHAKQAATFAVIVPTLNAGHLWRDWWLALRAQTRRPGRVIVLDSQSCDDTATIAASAGAEVITVPHGQFNHGGTRGLAASIADEDVLVYMTQDAILASPDSLGCLLDALADEAVGAAYGRQLPRPQAGPIERHNRLFGYPASSHRVSPGGAHLRGIRGPFLSDSYTAYRRRALIECGGFPARAIVSEDMYVGARLLQHRWDLAYVAEATVFHSHAYSFAQELQRYFDIGAFYSEQKWLLEQFGSGSGEGLRFVRSELAYLVRHAPWRIPDALLRTLIKFTGFKLGRHQRKLSPAWRLRLSGQKYYWRSDDRNALA